MATTIRKLAAIDIVFHGSRFIVAEFLAGVFGPLLLGLLSLLRGRAAWQTVMGVYMLLLAVDYVPLAIYAIILRRKGSARDEMAGELEQPETPSKYFRLSLLLLIPLVVPLRAIVEELRGRR